MEPEKGDRSPRGTVLWSHVGRHRSLFARAAAVLLVTALVPTVQMSDASPDTAFDPAAIDVSGDGTIASATEAPVENEATNGVARTSRSRVTGRTVVPGDDPRLQELAAAGRAAVESPAGLVYPDRR